MTNKPPLEKILGINPVKPDENEVKLPVLADDRNEVEQFQDDFEKSRANITHAINLTNKALTHMFNIALDKEDAKSFEALNQLLKTLGQSSKDLLEIHAAKKSFNDDGNKGGQQGPVNHGMMIQNAVFTGTPAEFRQYLKEKEAAEQSAAPAVIETKPGINPEATALPSLHPSED